MANVHVAYAVDPFESALTRWQRDYPDLSYRHQCQFSQDVDAALADASVDGCVITTPTNQHAAMITRALTAGKHVMCEKPLTDNVNDTIAAYELATRQGRHLFCAFTK